MPSLVTLQKQCRAKIEAAYKTAEAHYNKKIKRVPVVFSNQQSRTAGTASYQQNKLLGTITSTKIKLANKLLTLNPVEFVEETPGHEAAHCIAIELFGFAGTGHGARWKEVMNVIGQDAKRLHNMATPTANKVKAQCDCKTHMISKQRAGKMRNGTATYGCKKCKGPLRLTNIVTRIPRAEFDATVAKGRAKLAKPSAQTVKSKLPKVSNASLVRAFIKENYSNEAEATVHTNVIIDWASTLFKTRSAARSCVLANTPKVF